MFNIIQLVLRVVNEMPVGTTSSEDLYHHSEDNRLNGAGGLLAASDGRNRRLGDGLPSPQALVHYLGRLTVGDCRMIATEIQRLIRSCTLLYCATGLVRLTVDAALRIFRRHQAVYHKLVGSQISSLEEVAMGMAFIPDDARREISYNFTSRATDVRNTLMAHATKTTRHLWSAEGSLSQLVHSLDAYCSGMLDVYGRSISAAKDAYRTRKDEFLENARGTHNIHDLPRQAALRAN